MYSKIAILLAMAAVAYGGVIHGGFDHGILGHGVSSQRVVLDHSAPSLDFHDHNHLEEHAHAYPRYEFKYSVSDPETRDEKSHSETRDGDNVRGEYSLLQPDGKTRTVTYTANKEDGFQADVRYTGGDQHLHDHVHQFNDFDFHSFH